MTYANLEAAIIIVGLVCIGLGLYIVTGIIARISNANKRREESWRKFKEGDWV